MRSAETAARGSMMNIIDSMRKAKMICMAYCMKAIMSPTCMSTGATWCAPTQMMSSESPFMMSIMTGIMTTMTRLMNRHRVGQVPVGPVEALLLVLLRVEGADDHHAGEGFAGHQVEPVDQASA